MSYTVTHHRYGLIVKTQGYRGVPASDVPGLVKIAEGHGWDLVDFRLTQYYSALMVFTNAFDGKLWRIDLGLEEDDGMRPCICCKAPAPVDEAGDPSMCNTCMHDSPRTESNVSSLSFKVGDLVCVSRQPSNQLMQIEGRVALIQEIQGEYAHIQSIDEHGRFYGEGTVPLSCLDVETRPRWIKAARMNNMNF